MRIPTPQEHFGFRLGEDRKLARWPKIVEYFEVLAAKSARLRLEHLGLTTEGRPFIATIITSEGNMQRLEEIRQTHCRLADPRGLSEEEAETLKRQAKAVVMISCSIHATEVGGTQMSPELAYELCTRDDDMTRQILDDVILVFVPSLNPDGLEIVAEYYETTLGKPWEGGPLVELYHKYVGHDNNRDWFMLTQVESQLTVEKLHNVWHPMVVFDLHQTASTGARYFLPPFIDPYDPNADPLLWHEATVLGSAMMMDLLQEGKFGVTHSIIYDGFSPSRAYQHYHGGVRILSEGASCRIATPIELKFKDLQPARDGTDIKVPAVARPIPWLGGTWRQRDLVEYNKTAAWGCLKHAARYRDMWVHNFHTISCNGLSVNKPYAFVVPANQRDPVTAYEMVQTLERGMVEIHRAKAAFVACGVTYPAGSLVILTAQPYGRYAKTLLERQVYPDLRLFPGGPPKPPYDITAQTLPLQMGVACVEVDTPFEAELELIEKCEMPVAVPPGEVQRANGTHGFTMCPAMNSSFKAVNKLMAQGFEVRRSLVPAGPKGKEAVGCFLLPAQEGLAAALDECAATLGIRVSPANPGEVGSLAAMRLRVPRLGIYQSYVATADEGWTRFIFGDYGFPYEVLFDADVRTGGLARSYDSIVIPGQPASQITQGHKAGTVAPQHAGGLGELGRTALRDFTQAGGTLICLGPACDWAVDALGLRVKNVLQGLKSDDFYLPGSMLRASLDTSHPVAFGMPAETTVLHTQSPAFEVTDGIVVGRYPPSSVLQSGWILGEKHVQDRACVVEVQYGKGRAVLLGPRVQFRAQTRGAYKLLFNSIYLGSSCR